MKELLIILLLFNSFLAEAQKSVVQGRISDIQKVPIEAVTVSIYNAADSSLLNYTISDKKGDYILKGIPKNKNSFIVFSCMGYKKLITNKQILESSIQCDVQLLSESVNLENVTVVSFIPPVVIKKDTVEFNTSAFSGFSNEAIDELLKRLPGFEKNTNGGFSFNGKRVSRITVEGRDFFSKNSSLALKNLPAEYIDKVQVTNVKGTNLDNENDKTKEVNKPFGKIFVGGGSMSRYESGFIINQISSKKQLSILGFSNNLNKTGFSVSDINEINGRQMIQRITNNNTSVGNLYIGNNEGLQISSGVGINYGKQINKSIINLSYFITKVNSNVNSNSRSLRIFGDTLLTEDATGNQIGKTISHNANANYEYTIDSTFNFNIVPLFVNNSTFSDSKYTSTLRNSKSGILNESSGNVKTNGIYNNFESTSGFNWTTKNKKINSQLSLFFKSENIKSEAKETQEVKYYSNNLPLYNDSVIQNVIRNTNNVILSPNASINYLISNRSTLGFSMKVSGRSIKQDLNTFSYDSTFKTYEFSPGLSSKVKLEEVVSIPTINFSHNFNQKFSFRSSLGYNITNRNLTFYANGKQNNNFGYLIAKVDFNAGALNISYDTRVQQVSLTNLNPFVDSTSRTYIQIGNKDLMPTLSKNLSITYSKFNIKKINFNIFTSFDKKDNAITNTTIIDDSGRLTISPVNVNGNYSLSTAFGLSKQYLFKNKNSFTIRFNGNSTYDKQTVFLNNGLNKVYAITSTVSINSDFYLNKILTSTQGYSLTYYESRSQVGNYNNLALTTHVLNLRESIHWPKKLTFENDINLNYSPNVQDGYHKSVFLWNVALSLSILKHEQAQIRLSLYDLLNNNSYNFRYLSSNTLVESQSNSLKRYALLSLIYNIRPRNLK
jgi:hypothetical protein